MNDLRWDEIDRRFPGLLTAVMAVEDEQSGPR
jgi:hypothetical protein